MRAALGRGHGVAVGMDEAVARGRPVDRPFDRSGNAELVLEVDLAREGAVGIGRRALHRQRKEVGQAVGVVERRLKRRVAILDGGFPADFHAGEEVGLRPHHLEQARGLELERAEDFGIRVEGDGSPAPVRGGADLFHRAKGGATGKALLIKLLVARDLNHHRIRQRVDDGGADAVQAARGRIGLV